MLKETIYITNQVGIEVDIVTYKLIDQFSCWALVVSNGSLPHLYGRCIK